MNDRPPLGPYALAPHRPKRRCGTWRIEVVVPNTGRHELATGRTQRAAQDRAAGLLRKYGARLDANPQTLTLSGAAALYVHWCGHRRDWTDETTERMRSDLALFAVPPETRVVDVGDAFMDRWLDRLSRSGLALGSQKSRWATSVSFLIWAWQRRILTENPADRIARGDKPWCSRRGRKQLGRGKSQLRNTAEARAFLQHAGELVDTRSRVAVQLPLLTGLASGEVLHLQAGDLDFEAGVGFVREDADSGVAGSDWEVKTDSRRRTFALPPHLVADLHELTEHQAPETYLFASNRRAKRGAPVDAKWLRERVKDVCKAAGVRIVCTHGLRGTYSTLLTVHTGATSPEIARYLGHADQGQTAVQHYIGTSQKAPSLRLIDGGSGVSEARRAYVCNLGGSLVI